MSSSPLQDRFHSTMRMNIEAHSIVRVKVKPLMVCDSALQDIKTAIALYQASLQLDKPPSLPSIPLETLPAGYLHHEHTPSAHVRADQGPSICPNSPTSKRGQIPSTIPELMKLSFAHSPWFTIFVCLYAAFFCHQRPITASHFRGYPLRRFYRYGSFPPRRCAKVGRHRPSLCMQPDASTHRGQHGQDASVCGA